MEIKCPRCGSKKLMKQDSLIEKVFVTYAGTGQLIFIALVLSFIDYLFWGITFESQRNIVITLAIIWVIGRIVRYFIKNKGIGVECLECSLEFEVPRPNITKPPAGKKKK